MGITVREALTIGGLSNARVLGGNRGLEKKVECVTVLEVPDIIKWLKGCELILTSGYAISKDEKEQVKLIKDLSEKCVSGLIIKAHRFLEHIPVCMIESADTYELPLIELDQKTTYLDVIKPIMTEIVSREASRLARFEMIHKKLSEVAFAGGGLDKSISALASILESSAALTDKKWNILAQSPPGLFDRAIIINKRVPAAYSNEPFVLVIDKYKTCRVFPLVIGGIVEGFLIIEDRDFNSDKVSAIKGILLLLTQDLLRRNALVQVEQSMLSQFLEDLIFGHINSESVARRRGQFLGINEESKFTLLVIGYKNQNLDSTSLISQVHSDLTEDMRLLEGIREVYSLVIENPSNQLLLFIELENQGDNGVRNYMAAFIKDSAKKYQTNDMCVGISEVFEKLTNSKKAFHQAEEAMEFGQKTWGTNSYTFFSDIGIYRLLANSNSNGVLEEFIPRGLLKLVEYDEAHNSQLVSTLESYLKNAGDGKKTARDLYIHYKTLLYRLERISDIAKIDLQSGERRLEFHLGLKALDIFRKQGVKQD